MADFDLVVIGSGPAGEKAAAQAAYFVELVDGTASFENSHPLRVDQADGTARRLTGDVILIATGSSPSRPADIPFDDHAVYDSDTILGLDAVPRSLTVLGAGVIGCEYA